MSAIQYLLLDWIHFKEAGSWRTFFFQKNGPIPAPFCLFLSFSRYNFNNTNWKKHRWCAWNSNPGPQDGRCRRNHRATATAHMKVFLWDELLGKNQIKLVQRRWIIKSVVNYKQRDGETSIQAKFNEFATVYKESIFVFANYFQLSLIKVLIQLLHAVITSKTCHPTMLFRCYNVSYHDTGDNYESLLKVLWQGFGMDKVRLA